MPEYTFALGDVNHTPGLYLSWMLEAESAEEAVELSRGLFEDDEPLEVEHPEARENPYGLILRADPDEIGVENIIEVYDHKEQAQGG